MSSSLPIASLPCQRQPLGELPLHVFVAQSLQPPSAPSSTSSLDDKTPSPNTRGTSHTTSRSVSPHKQVLLQRHHQHRAAATLNPRSPQSDHQAPLASSSSSSSSPSNSPRPSPTASTVVASPSVKGQSLPDKMMSVEATPVRRKLFAAPAHSPSSSVPLEHSPILSSTTRYVKVPASVPRSLATMAGGSTTPVKARAGSSSSTSSRNRVPPTVPATPTDAPTTPRNARLHRPSPVSGPKPKSMVEPSPSTERHADSLALQARWASIQAGSTSRPRTPVPSDGEDGDSQGMVDGHHQQQGQQRLIDAADAGVASPRKSSALKSLPKKKYRVSKEEIAIAHEIAGSGPMGSPSPCKVASFSDGYFAARNDDDNDIHAARAGGSPIRGSPRRRSQSLKAEEVDIYALPEAIGDDVFSNAHLRQLSASKLFGDIKRRAPLGWTVYEDPVVDKQIDAAETKPMQDLHVLASPLAMSVPSTPNKENKRPLAEAEGDVKVEHGAEASPVGHNSARKRGTGGRLSLLAKAEDEVVDSADQATESRLAPEAAAVETTTVTSPPKKSRLSGNPKPESDTAPVHAAVHRSPDAVRGRSTRKASATGSATARKPAAAAAPAVASGGVASRTRSKVRTAL